MARTLYTLMLWLGLPLIALRLWLRSRREPGYAERIGERFGRYDFAAEGPVIWVHAVSVGEVRASVPLVSALRTAYPDHSVLVTCMTAAGREAIDQAFGASVLAGYLPYDYPFAVRRFLEHFRPRLAVLMETEIWINLLADCRRRSVPVALANARMSPGSARGYRRLSMLTRSAFGSLSVACAQSEADADRIAALGAHRVVVTGNLKFDVQPDAAQLAAGTALRCGTAGRQVLLLASTRDGEEALLLDALKGRLASDTLLVVVPRHPQRFDEVASIVEAAGLSCARRSRGETGERAQVLVGDTMGEMPAYYAMADVAVIGGSFLPFGGQNLIEACSVGTPVVVGPHVHNFSEAVRLAVECGAALQVEDSSGAIDAAQALMGDPARRKTMGEAGIALCAAHRGATARHLAAIEGMLRS